MTLMELRHRFTVPAPLDQTWVAFNDLNLLAPCYPGASLTGASGDSFSGSLKVKVGPVSLVYAGSGRFTERNEPRHRTVWEASASDRRGHGSATARVTTRLSPDGDGTAVEITTRLDVTGRPAQFGAGVIRDTGDRLSEQFASCLSDRLVHGFPASAVAASELTAEIDAGSGIGPEGAQVAADEVAAAPTGRQLVLRRVVPAAVVAGVLAWISVREVRRGRRRDQE